MSRRTGPGRIATSVHGPATVHIERLVIDGVRLDAPQVRRLQSVLIRELEGLIQDGGIGHALPGGARPGGRAPDLIGSADPNSSAFARGLAQRIYLALEPRS